MSIYLNESTNPWQHWHIDEFLSQASLDELKGIQHAVEQQTPNTRDGSERLFLTKENGAILPELWKFYDSICNGHYRLAFEGVTGQSLIGTYPVVEIVSDYGIFELTNQTTHVYSKLTAFVYTDHEQLYPGLVLGDVATESADNRCVFFVPDENKVYHDPNTQFDTVRRGLIINYFKEPV